jgi:hypothetical protein
MQGETCKKCGTFYEDPAEGFYWEERKHGWRKPCKKCIAEYNKTPKQRKKRYQANLRYLKTERGQEASQRSNANKLKKYWDEKKKRNLNG